MKLKDIIKTEKEIKKYGDEYGIDIVIENNLIRDVRIKTIAHFGNITCFEIMCNNVRAMGGYNNKKNIGYIIKSFIEIFELEEEDGIYLESIKNIPCRLIFDDVYRCIGFGHFMKDDFVLTHEFAKIDE